MGNVRTCAVSQAQCRPHEEAWGIPGPLKAVPPTVVVMVGYQAEGRALDHGLLLWQEVHALHPVVPPLKWETESAVTKLQQEQRFESKSQNPSEKSLQGDQCGLQTATVARDKENLQVREANGRKACWTTAGVRALGE